jgi:hypothetical protein
MQAVKFVLITLLVSASCASKKLLDKSSIGGNYILETHRVEKNKTIISGQFFHLESKSEAIPAFMNINGVIHQTDSGRFSFKVLPGNYKIEGSFIGKKWVVTRDINVVHGDSVFLRLYLIDDDRPLYEK